MSKRANGMPPGKTKREAEYSNKYRVAKKRILQIQATLTKANLN